MPRSILEPSVAALSWEAEAVRAKFSFDDAVIGETHVDRVALGYLNGPAAAFWLPRFLDYVRTDAPRDTCHLDGLLARLSDEAWVCRVRASCGPSWVDAVRGFLAWLAERPDLLSCPGGRRPDLRRAARLWA